VDPRQARLEQGQPGSSAAAALLSPLFFLIDTTMLRWHISEEGSVSGHRALRDASTVIRINYPGNWFHRSFSSRNTSLEESELEESEPVTPFYYYGNFQIIFF